MRQRKDHVITAVGGDAQPARLVGLAVEADVTGVPGEVTEQRETLRAWSGAGWERSADGTYGTWSCHARDVARLWRAFVWGSKRRGETWLVANRMVRVASLLGVWGMIDGGQLAWDGSQGAAERQGTGADRDVRSVRIETVPRVRDGAEKDRSGVPVLPPRLAAGRSADGHAAGRAPHDLTVVIEDPPTILRLRVPGRPGRIVLYDVRNWGVDVPPGPRTSQEEALWIADVMRRMVDELSRRHWGGLKATAGSQALATWRRAYMTHDVVAHNDDEVLALEEASYVGGRCECGVIGPVEGPLYWCDRRSAYGHACAVLNVPVKVIGRHDGRLGAICGDQRLARRCLSEAAVEPTEPSYPRAGGRGVQYPVGRASVVLAGPELADAAERGALRWIGRCVEYACEPALRGYAEAVWDARQQYDREGDEALAQWAKRLIVSLPGKLGQRVSDWVPAPEIPAPAQWLCWHRYDRASGLTRARSLGGMVQRQERSGWTYDAAPAVASWIQSAARVELLRAIRAAGWDQCLYWDTDSLLLTQAGFNRLCATVGMLGTVLGQWRLVRTVSRATIHGVKHYEHDGLRTCAGLPKADTAASGLADRYWYRQTFGMALAQGHAPQASTRLRHYVRRRPYTLGRIGDDGRVYPHVVADW